MTCTRCWIEVCPTQRLEVVAKRSQILGAWSAVRRTDSGGAEFVGRWTLEGTIGSTTGSRRGGMASRLPKGRSLLPASASHGRCRPHVPSRASLDC